METPTLDRSTSTPDAPSSLARVESKYGFVPNLAAAMAGSPELLHAYLEVEEAFRNSSLSAVEQEVVALTVSLRNACAYCMAGHSMLASMSGLGDASLAALRDGAQLPDERLEALRVFTTTVLDARGSVDEADIEKFLAAGFDEGDVLAVPLGIGFKMLSNLTHHLRSVPVDEPMAPFAWRAPTAPGATRVLVTGRLSADGGEALAQYQAVAGPILKRYGGKPILKVRPESSFLGDRPDLVVLIEFPSREDARAAFEDPDYLEVVPLRARAFETLDIVNLD